VRMAVILIGCVIVLLGLAGCQNTGGVKVIVEGGEEFPESLAGTWKADKSKWQLVFEPDGRITSAVVGLGWTKMTPGKATTFPTRFGGKGIFEPGLWTVQYDHRNCELSVELVIEHFYQDLGTYAMEGTATDLLVGPISQDGRIWEPDLFSTEKFIAHIPDPNQPGSRKIQEFSNVTEPEFRKTLVFSKVEPDE